MPYRPLLLSVLHCSFQPRHLTVNYLPRYADRANILSLSFLFFCSRSRTRTYSRSRLSIGQTVIMKGGCEREKKAISLLGLSLLVSTCRCSDSVSNHLRSSLVDSLVPFKGGGAFFLLLLFALALFLVHRAFFFIAPFVLCVREEY